MVDAASASWAAAAGEPPQQHLILVLHRWARARSSSDMAEMSFIGNSPDAPRNRKEANGTDARCRMQEAMP